MFGMGLMLALTVAWGLASTLLENPQKIRARRARGAVVVERQEPPELITGVVCFTTGCGTLNQSGAVFCRRCGERLVGSPMFDPSSEDREIWVRVPESQAEKGVRW